MILSDVSTRIKNYWPWFIQITRLAGDFIDAVSQALLDLYTAIISLPDLAWTDRGIRHEANDWKILPSGNETVAGLQAILSTRYAIHQARGTTAGIIADVKRVSGDTNATVTVLSETQSGWWLESTFPDIDAKTFLDAGKIVEVTMTNKSVYPIDDLKKTIQREIVPLNLTTVYL